MNQYLVDKLKEGRLNKGLRQSDVSKLTGIKPNTLSNYENGVSEPDIDTYLELCKIYDLDCASILDTAYNLKNDIDFSISAHEENIIKKYRNLDEYGKDMVDTVLQKEYERRSEHAQEFIQLLPPVLKPNLGDYAGAGLGVYLAENQGFTPVLTEVPEELQDIDFIIGVNGDSMEPLFSSE
ncbi:helix-turn-helix domain-containing protein, partial [[Clostridium] innocuum]|nr:helix-turn-helix domain-containing protein [[Clostridium] innocuum]